MDSVWMIPTTLLLMLASWLLRRLWLTVSHLLYDGHARPVVVIEFLVLIQHRLLPVHNSQVREDFLRRVQSFVSYQLCPSCAHDQHLVHRHHAI